MGRLSLRLSSGLALGGGGQLAWARNLGAVAAGDFALDQSMWAGAYRGSHANIPGWSFARASAGYAQNAAGVWQSFASGAMRRTDKGLLVEGARTNLCLQSQDFDNAAWTKSRTSIVANAATAPDGTLTAEKLVETTDHGTHRAYQIFTKAASAITYTLSVYIKAAERTFAHIRIAETGEGNPATVGINLTTGELGTPYGSGITGVSAIATPLADGWYRVSITGTTTTDTYVVIYVMSATGLTSGDIGYVGDAAQGLYLWGAQLEAASFPSSYIPTTTASATRAADVASIGSVTGIDHPFSVYLLGERVVDTGTFENWINTYAPDTNNRTLFYTNTSDGLVANMRAGGVDQALIPVGTVSVGSPFAAAARYAANSVQGAFNGVLGTEDTSATVPPAPSLINFPESFQLIKRWAILPFAASDAQLQAMTA